MDHPAVHFTTVFMAFFAIMNPVANASVFLGLTEGMGRGDRRVVATKSLLLAFGIIAVFSVGGRAIFDVFGITLPAFRIAGGLLVALVGYHMLHGQSSKVQHPHPEAGQASEPGDPDAEPGLDVWVSPLALPVLAGPGTIATAMNYAAGSSPAQIARVLAAFAAICLLTWLAFIGAGGITRVLGKNAIQVVTRLMGLILAVVGVGMVIEGVKGAAAPA